MIANCGHDERWKYSGGKAGDQNGTEWQLRQWYSYPWNCVLRHKDPKVGKLIAEMAQKGAVNDYIGYDQSERWSCLFEASKVGYDLSRIVVPCETDCSSGVITVVMCVGRQLGDPALSLASSKATYTGNMRSGFRALGFDVLTDSKYLLSDKWLLPGDILLNDRSHTAINIDAGSETKEAPPVGDVIVSWTGAPYYRSALPTLKRGDKGEGVKFLQSVLIVRFGLNCGCNLPDGDFGQATEQAVKRIQQVKGLVIDGIVSGATWEAVLT